MMMKQLPFAVGLFFALGACASRREAQSEPVDASARTSSATLPTAPTISNESAAAVPILATDLRLTHGLATGRASQLTIDDATVRGVLRDRTAPNLELRFTYRGAMPAASRAALGSGDAARVQIGAKLRAADGCNVVYAMLRIEPEPALVVQVKRNPDAHTHDDCNTGGYRTVKPDFRSTVPVITPGSTHRLQASLEDTQLKVWLDDAIVWRGDLGPEVLTFDGPVGFRTDNGRFDLVLSQPRWAVSPAP